MAERGYSPIFAESIYQLIPGVARGEFCAHHVHKLLAQAQRAGVVCGRRAEFTADGFYAPAQLVNDARHAQVRFRVIDVLCSAWDCALEAGDDGEPEVRLGLRMIVGLPEADALRIEACRTETLFSGVDDLAHRARLDRKAMNLLADAGALHGLTRHGHDA